MSVAPPGRSLRRLREGGSHRRAARASRFKPDGKLDLLFDNAASAIIDFSGAFLDAERRVGYRANGMNNPPGQSTAKPGGYVGAAIGEDPDIEITPNPVCFRAVGDKSV
jgi:hypothetical protein